MVAALVAPVSLTAAPRSATRQLRAGAAPARAARVVSARASAEERQVRPITRMGFFPRAPLAAAWHEPFPDD